MQLARFRKIDMFDKNKRLIPGVKVKGVVLIVQGRAIGMTGHMVRE